MKKVILHIVTLLLLATMLSNCSTKKNTWTTRTYKAINTRFNVYFNGMTSYEEGMKNIIKANVEDFSDVIPMYPISKPANAKTAASSMDKTIEKCRKAIKLHSIKQKPELNTKKANKPEYKLFYNQKEFNPALKDAWLLLAKAEFHKGDFLGSVGTFAYIARFYSTDKDMVTKCKLWTARAYLEMGWIYEAEQVLSKLTPNDISTYNTDIYTSVNAELMIKKDLYKEAIPFLEITLSKEKDKYLKQRFSYLLAQLYQKTGNNQAAFGMYQKVLKLSPPYDMDFNARINSIELNSGNVNNIRKDIKKMIKNPNNKDYLDQLYYVMGKTYLQKSDTLKAIENFIISADKSTRNGVDKALTLITLGDLYYNKKDYVKAQPRYDDASKIITNEHPEFNRVSSKALSLGELVVQYEIVTLQDSLQRLAALPESKRLEIVNKIIEKVIADEKAAAEKKDEQENQGNQGNFEDIENGFTPPANNNLRIGNNNVGEWYFYNANTMKTGQQDFLKKWGKRKLEDNWRRMNKSAVLFADEKETVVPDSTSTLTSTDTTTTKTKLAESDNKNPDFYLQQIPVTPAQIKNSNAEIATAMYNMGFIYKEKVEDLSVSIQTFEEFQRRFPTDERIPETLYQVYLMQTKNRNKTVAEAYRSKLLSNYPESKQAILLKNPDYIGLQTEMLQVQDSIYNLTYKAFNASDFNTVKKNTADFVKKYPQSNLAPKFLFLNALSIGKTEKSDVFESVLSKLVENYPESDVSAMSKDMLALMKQGKEAQTGTSQGTLLALREEVNKTEDTEIENKTFTAEKKSKHRLLLITSQDDLFINKLLYNVASFNFSRFMVKDFDLSVNKLDSVRKVLSVTNFESYDETEWYINSLSNDSALSNMINRSDIQNIIISEANFGLLKTMFSLDEYLSFQSDNLVIQPEVNLAQNVVTKTSPKQEPVKTAVVATKPESTTRSIAASSKPIIAEETTEVTATAKPATAVPTTSVTVTPKPTTTVPTTSVAVTPKQTTSVPTTTVAVTPKPTTSVATTSVAVTPKPTTSVAINSVTATSTPISTPVEKLDKAYADKLQNAVPEKSSIPIPVNNDTKTGQNATNQQGSIKAVKDAPIFKNLFTFRPTEPHFVAIPILSGNINFEKTKTAFDSYNANNYGIMNLKVTLETIGKMQIIIIGSFTDANIAKSYLIRMVKDKTLFENMNGASYRNLVGSQKNLNIMMEQNAIKTYIEFMQMYYLK